MGKKKGIRTANFLYGKDGFVYPFDNARGAYSLEFFSNVAFSLALSTSDRRWFYAYLYPPFKPVGVKCCSERIATFCAFYHRAMGTAVHDYSATLVPTVTYSTLYHGTQEVSQLGRRLRYTTSPRRDGVSGPKNAGGVLHSVTKPYLKRLGRHHWTVNSVTKPYLKRLGRHDWTVNIKESIRGGVVYKGRQVAALYAVIYGTS